MKTRLEKRFTMMRLSSKVAADSGWKWRGRRMRNRVPHSSVVTALSSFLVCATHLSEDTDREALFPWNEYHIRLVVWAVGADAAVAPTAERGLPEAGGKLPSGAEEEFVRTNVGGDRQLISTTAADAFVMRPESLSSSVAILSSLSDGEEPPGGTEGGARGSSGQASIEHGTITTSQAAARKGEQLSSNDGHLESVEDTSANQVGNPTQGLWKMTGEGAMPADGAVKRALSGAAPIADLSFDAFGRVRSERGNVCVVFDYDDTLVSTGAWVINKLLWHLSLHGGDSHYPRGLAYPGVAGAIFRAAEGPVKPGEEKKFFRPVLPILLSARLTEAMSSVFRSRWFRSMLRKTVHRGYTRWKGWRGRIGLRGLRGGDPKAVWRVGHTSNSTLHSLWLPSQRSKNKLKQISKVLGSSGHRSFGRTIITPGTRFVTFGDIKEDDPELFGSLVTLKGNLLAAGFLHMVYDHRPHYFKALMTRFRKMQESGLNPLFRHGTIKRGNFFYPSLHIDYVVRLPGAWVPFDAATMPPYNGENCSSLSTKQAYVAGRQLGDMLRHVISFYLKSFVRVDRGMFSEYHSEPSEMPVLFLRCRGILTGFEGSGGKKAQISYVPTNVEGEPDLGVPIVAYRTMNAVATAGYFMNMWDEVDTMRLIIDTVRDQRDTGDPMDKSRRYQWADLLADVMAFKPVMDEIKAKPEAFSRGAVELLRDARDAVFAVEDFLCVARHGKESGGEGCRVLMDTSREIGAGDPLYDDSSCQIRDAVEGNEFASEKAPMKEVQGIDHQEHASNSPGVSNKLKRVTSCFGEWAPAAASPTQDASSNVVFDLPSVLSDPLPPSAGAAEQAANDLRDKLVSRCLSLLHWRTIGTLELSTETMAVTKLAFEVEKGFLAAVKRDELRLDDFGRLLKKPPFPSLWERETVAASSDDSTTTTRSTKGNSLSAFSDTSADSSIQSTVSEWDRAASLSSAASPLTLLLSYLPHLSSTAWPQPLWGDGAPLRLLAFTAYLYANGKLWQTRKAPVGSNILLGHHFLLPDPKESISYRAIEKLNLRVNHGRFKLPEMGKLDWVANSLTVLRQKWNSHIEAFIFKKMSLLVNRLVCVAEPPMSTDGKTAATSSSLLSSVR